MVSHAPFLLTSDKEAVKEQVDFLPAVHKIGERRLRWQKVQLLRSPADLDKAFEAPGFWKKFIDFERELAVIVRQNECGRGKKSFPSVEMCLHPVSQPGRIFVCPSRQLILELTKKRSNWH